jgi:ankyrin repeat protein
MSLLFDDLNFCIIKYRNYDRCRINDTIPEKRRLFSDANNNVLLWACKNGYLDIVKYLVGMEVDIHSNNNYALLTAFNFDRLDVAIYLLLRGASLSVLKKLYQRPEYDEKINSLLILASSGGHISIVENLLKNDANPCFNNNAALRLSYKNGYFSVARLLVHNGANLHVYNNLLYGIN